MATYSYRRLLPRESGVFSYAELWAAEDHLLSVASRRLSVAYQRFPLAEIRAISVTTLPHWTIPQIIGLFTAVTLFAASVLAPTLPGVPWVLGFLTIWPLAIAAREVLRGPRCRTMIHTATGAHPLPAVARQRRVEEFLSVVAPMIEAVQGGAERLEITERPVEHPEETAREQLSSNRGLRLFAFGGLLIEGIFSAVEIRWPQFGQRTEVMLLELGLYLSVVAVLLTVWRRSTPLLRRDRVYLLAGSAIALALGELALVMVYALTAAFRTGLPPIESWAAIMSAGWRIPLAMAALILELRRK